MLKVAKPAVFEGQKGQNCSEVKMSLTSGFDLAAAVASSCDNHRKCIPRDKQRGERKKSRCTPLSHFNPSPQQNGR